MSKEKDVDKLPAALGRHVMYNGQMITCKDWIDALIADGFDSAEFYKTRYRDQVILIKGKLVSRPFRNISEVDYIRACIPHFTIRKAEKGAIIPTVPDNAQETPPIQNATHGNIIQGPSHDNGGVDVVINKKPVIEAQGGEIIMNNLASEKYCSELSEMNASTGGITFDCAKAKQGVKIPKFSTSTTPQEPDTQPGPYYVSMISHNGENVWLLSGPYDKHSEALAEVDKAQKLAQEHDRNMIWSKFGTMRMDPDYSAPGILNKAGLMECGCKHEAAKGMQVDNSVYRIRWVANGKEEIFETDSYALADTEWDNIISLSGIEWARMKKNTRDKNDNFSQVTVREYDTAAKGAQVETSPITPHISPLSDDYSINKQIEKLIDEKGDNHENYTADEKQLLRRYSGYGGIKSETMTEAEIKGSFSEFYTPDPIIQKIWALAFKYGFKDGGSVLEPSVGTGEFLKYVPENSTATGYEVNKYSYSISKILYPAFNFYLQPFEQVFIKNRDTIKNKIADLPKYDLVIGNPPYGDVGGVLMGMGEKQYTKSGNWIEYFILRGLDLTKPGGLLIYIIGTEVSNGGIPWLQQGTSKVKEMVAERAELVDAYRLPNGVFERTDVLTDIVVFKRK